MASTAKIMTALLILEDHPLALNEHGPSITVTQEDVQKFQRAQAEDQSVVAVFAGERLTERQLLDGLLIPSANNFADLLAEWDSGSRSNFVDRMNVRARQLKLTATHFADPSGIDPAGVSVPEDLVEIARTAMAIPVFAEIVHHSDTVLPSVGRVRNYDRIIGQAGIIGVKTGNSDAVGGNFVFAADLALPGKVVRFYGAVMGQSSLQAAFDATLRLLRAAQPHVHFSILVHRFQRIGGYTAAWGASATVHPDDFMLALYFDGMTLEQNLEVRWLDGPTSQGSHVGSLTASIGGQRTSLPVILDGDLEGPGLGWRLFRPLGTP
jgi:D-alanyl-D-alanine carboxypeptidase (penicillin-binding protein 5/6)